MTRGTDDPPPTIGDSVTGKNAVVECPRCGKDWGNLPNHLPTCDGGEE